jgi:hypothetical protein
MESLEERVASMPYSKTLRPGVACTAIFAILLVPSAAAAATTTAHLRVVNTAGTTLADQSQVTGDVTIKTDPGAECFGSGTGGTGMDRSMPGPNALGIVKDASASNGALRPLSVTDYYYPGFGLGLCGVGGFQASGSASWYVKVNHVGTPVSGSQSILNSGDEVLWYLTPTYPYADELQLIAPTVAQAGKPFTVTVFSYDNAGHRSPVAGAVVGGAELPTPPTGADGITTVQLTKSAALQAQHGSDIPSNRPIVCVLTPQNTCGATRNRIIGTNRGDRIRGSGQPDQVRARAGDDRVNTNGGLPDIVNCGRGKDKAVIGSNDVARRCEKVIRKR